jgi:UDP:flavonoid glycosyltransferase YjiC (YdhE family)
MNVPADTNNRHSVEPASPRGAAPDSDGPGGRRPRILFVAEAVTLAHVARPFVLARSLEPDRCDICLACDPRYNKLLGPASFPLRAIHSIPTERFLEALAQGSPLYDAATLRGYVQEDLRLLEDFKPDVVVGDFRLSLAVSARRTGTPYVTLTNAYWSPYARQRYPLPEIPVARALGTTLGGFLFRTIRPFAFAYHTRPLNRVLREYGLPSLGLDLRRIYTEADYTLYADTPELLPTFGLPANHRYLGPVLWSPAGELPPWWKRVPADKPIVYVTLGSSGPGALLGRVLETLADLPVSVIAATAGRAVPARVPANAFLAEYLPGNEAAARAALVICNGGSPTTHQALAAGVPVLGLPANLDQYLNMQAVCRTGAGTVLRSGTVQAPELRATVERMLAQPTYATAARGLAESFARYPAGLLFQAVVAEALRLAPPRATPPQSKGT